MCAVNRTSARASSISESVEAFRTRRCGPLRGRHPGADFAYHAIVYHMPPHIVAGFGGANITALGIPSEADYLAAYCTCTERSGMPNYEYYLAFNFSRMAAIFHGIKGRVVRGNASDPQAHERVRVLPELIEVAWQQAVRAGGYAPRAENRRRCAGQGVVDGSKWIKYGGAQRCQKWNRMRPRKQRPITTNALPRTQVPDDVIKSCGRTLQILEYIEDVKRPVSAVELVEALDYPQSSVSALLHSMSVMGFLHWDSKTRLYSPTLRVRLLGHWMDDAASESSGLLRAVDKLSETTGDTVVLATRRSLYAQYIHVAQAMGPDRLKMTTGATIPLCGSGTGFALLSGYSHEYVRRIVHRSNAEHLYQDEPYSLKQIQERVDRVRLQGYAFEVGLINPAGAVLAFPLSIVEGDAPLVLTIGGQRGNMINRLPELINAAREALAELDAGLHPIKDSGDLQQSGEVS